MKLDTMLHASEVRHPLVLVGVKDYVIRFIDLHLKTQMQKFFPFAIFISVWDI